MDPSQIKAKTTEWKQALKMLGFALCDCMTGFLDLKGIYHLRYISLNLNKFKHDNLLFVLMYIFVTFITIFRCNFSAITKHYETCGKPGEPKKIIDGSNVNCKSC